MFQRTEAELTGRVRARPGWFGRQIMQVEVRTFWYSASPPPPGRDAAAWREQMIKTTGGQRLGWRDATWEDTQVLQLLESRKALDESVARVREAVRLLHEFNERTKRGSEGGAHG